jgi:hypothetical protein
VPFPLDSPAAIPSPWIKASGFASHPFGWFALASLLFLTAYFLDRINRIFQDYFFFFSSFQMKLEKLNPPAAELYSFILDKICISFGHRSFHPVFSIFNNR